MSISSAPWGSQWLIHIRRSKAELEICLTALSFSYMMNRNFKAVCLRVYYAISTALDHLRPANRPPQKASEHQLAAVLNGSLEESCQVQKEQAPTSMFAGPCCPALHWCHLENPFPRGTWLCLMEAAASHTLSITSDTVFVPAPLPFCSCIVGMWWETYRTGLAKGNSLLFGCKANPNPWIKHSHQAGRRRKQQVSPEVFAPPAWGKNL